MLPRTHRLDHGPRKLPKARLDLVVRRSLLIPPAADLTRLSDAEPSQNAIARDRRPARFGPVGSSLRSLSGASVSVLALIALLGMWSGACLEQNTNRVEIQSTNCIACHAAELERAASPPHASLGWTLCAQCHTEEAWIPAVPLQHDWFPLRFTHAQLACTACHAVGYGPGQTPTACFGCHEATTTPRRCRLTPAYPPTARAVTRKPGGARRPSFTAGP